MHFINQALAGALVSLSLFSIGCGQPDTKVSAEKIIEAAFERAEASSTSLMWIRSEIEILETSVNNLRSGGMTGDPAWNAGWAYGSLEGGSEFTGKLRAARAKYRRIAIQEAWASLSKRQRQIVANHLPSVAKIGKAPKEEVDF